MDVLISVLLTVMSRTTEQTGGEQMAKGDRPSSNPAPVRKFTTTVLPFVPQNLGDTQVSEAPHSSR